VQKLKENNLNVILTVHWEIKELTKIYDYIDKFIYHKNPLYLSANDKKIKILPMGIPVFKPMDTKEKCRLKYGFSNSDFILTTIGFLHPWKNYSSILELLAPLIKSNKNYKVQMLTSYNDIIFSICHKEDIKIKNVIKKYNLEDQVIHITDFLNQQEYSERIWISDLGYLWGNIDSKATTASAKEFITCHVPLVTTHCSHFHDIKQGTLKSECNKEEFILLIKKTISNKKTLQKLKNESAKQYQNFNYESLIDLFINEFIN